MVQGQGPTSFTWLENILDILIGHLQNDVVKAKIKHLVLEPFLQYCIELIFPYDIDMCSYWNYDIINDKHFNYPCV